jgi:hypothetical protein
LSGNYILSTNTNTANITALGLTVTGITASNRVYDTTTNASLNTAAATLVGVLTGDAVVLDSSTATGSFSNSAVSNAKTVTITGLALCGTDSSNYTLVQPTTRAIITKASRKPKPRHFIWPSCSTENRRDFCFGP